MQCPLLVCSLRPLSPIVEHVEPPPAITGLVWPVHSDSLDHRAEAAHQHVPVGFLARQIGAGQHIRHAGFARERGAGIEQRAEPRFGTRSWPYGAKFNETTALPGFARGTPMADGKARESPFLIP